MPFRHFLSCSVLAEWEVRWFGIALTNISLNTFLNFSKFHPCVRTYAHRGYETGCHKLSIDTWKIGESAKGMEEMKGGPTDKEDDEECWCWTRSDFLGEGEFNIR